MSGKPPQPAPPLGQEVPATWRPPAAQSAAGQRKTANRSLPEKHTADAHRSNQPTSDQEKPPQRLAVLGGEESDRLGLPPLPPRRWVGEILPGWGGSLIIHIGLLLVLALIWWLNPPPPEPLGLRLAADVQELALESASTNPFELKNDATKGLPVIEPAILLEIAPIDDPTEALPPVPGMDVEPGGLLAPVAPRTAGPNIEGALEGRQPDRRRLLLEREGGSQESEQAVRRGLQWLVHHQAKNGAWYFDHRFAPPGSQGCHRCRDPGKVASSTGSTALALLPFLGAAQTHRQGEYREVVAKALYYLISRARARADGFDFQEGTMYSQGFSAIALSEAYALSGDRELGRLAQGALDFVVAAQEETGGGWRYFPGQPGDTSMHGWQVMALRSGQMAYLNVPVAAVQSSNRFLDSVQVQSGIRYRYMPSDKKKSAACDAIGLLCRMYSGWTPGHTDLDRGVKRLAQLGPSPDDMYYNYYATQVLHHYGGPQWVRWNQKMRDQLIKAQAKRGHESGSWHFSGNNGDTGGRLYNTALAILTLEVYYRHLPLYRPEAVKARF